MLTTVESRFRRDRLRLEAPTSARIRHENLVAVTDFGETLDGPVRDPVGFPWIARDGFDYPGRMPHPLLSDPWVAAKIDKAVAKYGKLWTPAQIEAFREQMAWTLATHPQVSKVLEVAHPSVIDSSGERVLGGDVDAKDDARGKDRKAGNK